MHNLEKIVSKTPSGKIATYIYSYHSYDEIHSNLENSVPAYTKSELVHDSIILRHKDYMEISNTYNRNIRALYEHYIRT
jgi:hypothetical protein